MTKQGRQLSLTRMNNAANTGNFAHPSPTEQHHEPG